LTTRTGPPMSQQGFILWLTGLSGAGKSTLARAVRNELTTRGLRVEVLDGDEIRATLSRGLGFSREDRNENVRRIGFVARLLARNGVASVVAAISPYRAGREEVRSVAETPFVEVFVDCPLDEVIRRDTHGLYEKALRGELSDVTGISSPYEPPFSPELRVMTASESVQESNRAILRWLERENLVPAMLTGPSTVVR
jgi:adenylylsulfate kinase